MIIYQAEKKQFLDDVFKNDIEAIVLDSFSKRTGRRVGTGEVRAWASSFQPIVLDATAEGSAMILAELIAVLV